MEPPILVDSSIYIGLLRAGRDPVAALGNKYPTIDLATCGIVRLEVLRGIRIPKVVERMGAFFDVLQNVPTDNRLWDEAVAVARNTQAAGYTIPGTDALIAAAAFRIGAAVFSFDRHFTLVPGLTVIQDAI
ncbi:MAG: PIN domain-containing protein [Verrucomicrobiales bacterium]|nr:PIN domain-containing protein [Verrucomicrobiales bacterium]